MNDELKDFELTPETSEGAGKGPDPNTPRWPWIVAVAVVLLAVIAFVWFRTGREDEGEMPAAPAAPTVAESLETEEGSGELVIGEVPPLADTDPWLQQIVEQLSSHPQLAEWMLTPELIRGFVVVVDNVAEGVGPRKHLEMMVPKDGFTTRESDGEVLVDPASYRRFNVVVEVIESLDTEGTAELYQAIRPLCQQAYQDLGYPGEDFEATLSRAVNRLLAVPVVDRPITLEKKITAYRFQDPELEKLSPAAKQFLRLGPENLRRLQAKVRSLALAIGLEGVS